MPNYVMNFIQFSEDAPQKRIDEIFQNVMQNDPESGRPFFDFNVLIPMPEELIIPVGSETQKAIDLYRAVQAAQATVDITNESLYALGERACTNIEKYGYAAWYDWSVANWGTKWNSFDASFNRENRGVVFLTAWSFPEPIAVALAHRFPDVDFVWEYAEEAADFAGVFVQEEGETSHIEYSGDSTEAQQIYANCWGESC